jgi:hypothetical protein
MHTNGSNKPPRIKAFYGISPNLLTTQVWIARSIGVLAAIRWTLEHLGKALSKPIVDAGSDAASASPTRFQGNAEWGLSHPG